MPDRSQSANLQRFMRKQPVKVIAVCSGKGGVGKTNIATNLAVALAAQGRNTCLLDADVSLANVDVLLGLQPRFNLSHVVRGEADLDSTVVAGPHGLRIVPASSGSFCMTDLPAASQAGIIQAFGEMADQPEIMVVDTAAGISASVARFVQAAQHAFVVVCDEPASLTDAYALIKVFSQNYGLDRFNIITNQSERGRSGSDLFNKLLKVTDSFLDVVLRHIGDVPQDEYLVKAVREQRAVYDAFPKSVSGRAFERLAKRADALPANRESSGGIEFFFERLLTTAPKSRGKVA